MRKKESRLLL